MAGFLDDIDLQKLATFLSGSAAASANANVNEGNYQNRRDEIKAQLFNTQQNAASRAAAQALDNAKYTTALPGVGASEAVRGSLIQNLQDVQGNLGTNHANVINFSGGTRPSSLTPEARAAGGDLIKHGQSLIADPGSFVPAVAGSGLPGSPAVPAPRLADEPKAGFWGTAAGVGGAAAGLANALGGGGPKSGSDLAKLLDLFKRQKRTVDDGYSHDPNAYGQDEDPWTSTDDGYSHDPNAYGEDDPTGSTSGTAYGPDGQPLPTGPGGGGFFNPENPDAALTDWWTALPQPNGGGGGDDENYWGDE